MSSNASWVDGLWLTSDESRMECVNTTHHFPKAAALLWNSLPASLRDTNSNIASFQRCLKTFLFRQEFENAL